MSADLLPFDYNGQSVRTVMVEGEPWFVLSDLCAVLGLSNPSVVAQRVDASALSQTEISSGGQGRSVTVVSEAGMYEVVIRSDKPEAIAFRRWLTGTVLPQIRKTGSFVAVQSREERMALGLQAAQELLAEKDQQIAELAPKAEVADRLLDADGDMSVGDTAKALTRAGIKVGEQRLFTALELRKWIFRAKGDGRWRVYQTAIESGHMSVIPQSHYHPKTGVLVLDPPQPRVTPKGLQRLLLDHGAVVPA